jgi:hypothetical protein
MEFFPLIVNSLAIAAVTVGILLGSWWIIGLYWVRNRSGEDDLTEESLPGDYHEESTGVPPVLTIFYIFIGVSLIVYVIYTALRGISY